MTLTEFYQEYRAYCARNGEYTRSTTVFYSALETAGFERRKTKSGVFVNGIRLKERQLESLKSHAAYTTPCFDGMPHGSPFHSSFMEESAVRIMELEELIADQIRDLISLRREIAGTIASINNPEYETLLEMRYLSFMEWDEIAARLGYGGKYVFRVHGRALELIKIPK